MFVEQTLFSHRTDTNFPRNSYLVLEHIRISMRPYLVLKHIQFSMRSLCFEQIRIFQESTSRRTDISLIGLGGNLGRKSKNYYRRVFGNTQNSESNRNLREFQFCFQKKKIPCFTLPDTTPHLRK